MKRVHFFMILLLSVGLTVSCSKDDSEELTAINAKSQQGMQQGNGAPSGAHYNLNIIGVDKGKTADMTGNMGHRIFVKLEGKTKINLGEGEFQVLDANGTDRDGASFQLPSDVATTYAVYARPLGKPGTGATMTTCAEDPDTGDVFCSTDRYVAVRDTGKSSFTNVSKELLTLTITVLEAENPELYACLGGKVGDVSITTTVDLFDACLENYFWEYDNNGLRVLQLRFYAM